jgi:hypothetical protein
MAKKMMKIAKKVGSSRNRNQNKNPMTNYHTFDTVLSHPSIYPIKYVSIFLTTKYFYIHSYNIVRPEIDPGSSSSSKNLSRGCG